MHCCLGKTAIVQQHCFYVMRIHFLFWAVATARAALQNHQDVGLVILITRLIGIHLHVLKAALLLSVVYLILMPILILLFITLQGQLLEPVI